MQAKFSPDRIVELLVKIRTGKLDEAEQAELDAWIAADADNRALYRRLSDNSYLQKQYPLFETNQIDDWRELTDRMAATARRKLLIRNIVRGAVAAAVTLAIVVPLSLINNELRSDSETQISQNISLERNKAIIELETGEQIALDQSQDRSVRLISGIGVIYGDSLLRYDVSKTSGEMISAIHTLRVPKGAAAKIVVLSDKTRVWLNAGSSITYPVVFPENKRPVSIEGECYFDVAHDAGRPFVVETQEVSIRVMGTQFNVMSYVDNKIIETTLVSGCVGLSATNKEVVLQPGVQAIYDKHSHDIALRDVDTRIYTAWKEDIFESNNMTIESIAHVLSQWHDVEFVFETKDARFLRFNGTIKRNKSLEFTLDRIRDTKTINYKIENKKVIVMKK